jgi:hypothetical protein
MDVEIGLERVLAGYEVLLLLMVECVDELLSVRQRVDERAAMDWTWEGVDEIGKWIWVCGSSGPNWKEKCSCGGVCSLNWRQR